MNSFLTFYIGKYKRLLFTIVDADTKLPTDITADTFQFTVKSSKRDPDSRALILLRSGSGVSVVDGPSGTGQIDVLVSATSSLPLVEQQAVWDFQILRGGNPEIVDHGECVIKVPVTRAET